MTAADEAALALIGSLNQPDPYPTYARLRDLAPVYVPPEGPVLVTSYRGVTAMLHSPHAGKDSDQRAALFGVADWREHPGLRLMYSSILQLDGPEHARLRALVSRVFTPRRTQAMLPAVQAVVDRLTERLRSRAGEAVDLLAEWAFPLPIAVIGDLLGVPEQDRPPFAAWVRDHALSLEPRLTPEQLERCGAAGRALDTYFRDLVAQRRADPRDDLTSELAALDDLGDDDLVIMLVLLFAAGFETTTHLLGNAVAALTAHPGEIERLRGDPSLAGNAVEELLRFDSPVQINSRVLRTKIEVDDDVVPAGRIVFSVLGAANRDPARFPEPDRLDLGRADVRPMSFGGGAHFCLGASLARLEAARALTALFTAFDVAPDGAPERREGLALHGHAHLPVRLTARA